MTTSPPALEPRTVATPGALGRLGSVVVARRRLVLVLGLLGTVLVGAIGVPAMGAMVDSRYETPGSESVRAAGVLAGEFGAGTPNVVLMVTAKAGTVDDPAVAEAGQRVADELAGEGDIRQVASYWSQGSLPTLRSEDRRHALIVGWLPGEETAARDRLDVLTPAFTRDEGTIRVQVGGTVEVFRSVATQARQDFSLAEMIIFPAAFVLLALMLRSALVALLPLGIAVFTIAGTLALLRGVMAFTDISIFASNLTLVLGLGLGVDYSLFVISRFREELDGSGDPGRAAIRAVQTAGRTVIFSGVTVAVSLAALFLLPFPFLRSAGYAGVGVVLCGIVGSVVILPAILAVMGHRANRGRLLGRYARAGGSGFWRRTVKGVMRRPLLSGGLVVALLLLLGTPFLNLSFGAPDDRILPPGTEVRQLYDVIRADFVAEEADALQVVVPDLDGTPASMNEEIARYAGRLSTLDGVVRVDSAAGSFSDGDPAAAGWTALDRFAGDRATWLSVVVESERLDADPSGVVAAVRGVSAPFDVLVGGYPALLADYTGSLLDRLPLLLGVVFAVTFVILFLMTGSLLIPIKATVTNALSLSVMFGAVVWIFQEGNLSGLLGFTATGSLETSIPILMFCVAFGLSMDYEVFLMARIAEEYQRTGDNESSVVTAIERSAPLITGAAAILALSFATYATSGIVFLKMLGITTAIAVMVDATLIRAILVPAAMRLAGRANWWAPKPLRRLHDRFGLSES